MIPGVPSPTTPETPLGRAIRTARRIAQLSGRDLGVAVGVDQSVVSGWELGKTLPSLEQLSAIERAVNVDFGVLFRAGGYAGGDGAIEAAVLRNDVLSEADKEVLLKFARWLLGQRY